MKISQIEAFIEIAKCQSISRAAENLYTNQSTLSSLLSSFEKELQLTLFNRSKKGVSLTADGKQIFDEALLILQIIRRWNTLHLNNQVSGTVTVVAPPALCSTLLLDIISQAKAEHPTLKIHNIEAKSSGMLYETIVNPDLNIMIVWFLSETEMYSAIQLARAHSYESSLLFEDNYNLIMNSHCPLAKKEFLSLADLSNVLFVSVPSSFSLNATLPTPVTNAFSSERRIELPNFSDILNFLAMNCNAISFASSEILRLNYAKEILTVKTLTDYPLPAWCVLFYPSSSTISVAEKYVVNLIKMSV